MTRVQEWLSSNKNRAYPFVEDSDLGVLPTWTLLDIQVVDAAPDLTGDGVLCNGFDVLPEAAVLHFSKGAAAFDIRVVRGSGMLLGVIDVSATLKVKYAVFGGGREYAFPDEGAYAISAKILPSKVVSIEKTARLWSLNGRSGVIHVADGYNTTTHVIDGEVVVEVGAGLGLGDYCDGLDGAFDCSQALLFVNGQHADTSGNLNIVGGTGISVQTGRTALVGGKVVPALTMKVSDAIKGVL